MIYIFLFSSIKGIQNFFPEIKLSLKTYKCIIKCVSLKNITIIVCIKEITKNNQDKKWVTIIESSFFVDEVRASDMISSWYQNKWLSCNVKKKQRNVCDQLFVIQLVMFSGVTKNVIQVLTWQPKRHANITILWIYACLQAAIPIGF